jgi:hypothetical protein
LIQLVLDFGNRNRTGTFLWFFNWLIQFFFRFSFFCYLFFSFFNLIDFFLTTLSTICSANLTQCQLTRLWCWFNWNLFRPIILLIIVMLSFPPVFLDFSSIQLRAIKILSSQW